jgi:superfamily II DNA helicase RecQ
VALTRARTQVVALANEEAPSIFLDELDGARVRPPARSITDVDRRSDRRSGGTGRAGGAGRARRSGTREVSVFADVRLPRVEAVPGLVVEDRGSIGTVVEVTADAAVLSVGSVRLKVTLGSDVKVDGRTVTLVGPGAGSGGSGGSGGGAASSEAEKALRAWRTALASQEAVPAYVILKDAELTGIAARDPSTLADLAACRGMGQIRLERWGDEILSVLDTARSA